MKIDNQVKYDLSDLICLQEREFTFKYSKRTWTCVPIIASNMDTVGTFEMYDSLSKHKCIVAFHKFYTLQDYINKKSTLDPNFYSLTTGIRDDDWRKTKLIIDELKPYFLTIDVVRCSKWIFQ